MSRQYRDNPIDLISTFRSAVLYEVKQKRAEQNFREQDRDIRSALRFGSASDYLRDDNENPV